MARILVACEESQATTKAFRALGHEAFSCDLLPCSGGHPEWHFQEDIFGVLAREPKFDLMIAHPPCFSHSTLITTDKGLVPISEIKIGDMVLTHTGEYKEVYKTMNRTSNHYRILKSSNNVETITTDEHPYYVRLRDKRKDLDADFIEAKYLTRNHFTGAILPIKEEDVSYSDTLLYTMGRYVADGHLRKSRYTLGKFEEMTLSIGNFKLDTFKQNTKDLKYSISTEKNKSVSKVSFYSNNFCELFEQFGRGADNKNIPQWVIELPKERLKVFLKGYLDGDGHVKNDTISCSTISKKLAIQIGLIISKVYNTPYSISKSKEREVMLEGRVLHCKELYTIKTKINSKIKQNYFEDNISWGRVLKNDRVEKSIEVYNISVKDDESYVANGVIVHNCTYLAGSGAQWLSNPEDKHLPFEERRPHPKYPNRRQDMLDSVEFVKKLYESNVEHIAIENPVGLLSSRWRKPDQIVQPYMFGDEATKTTCLWLKNLPLLSPTNIVGKGERTVFGSGKSHPKWYADALKNAKTKEERQTLRSKTFQGMAEAFASQWGNYINNK